ncbi:ATP-dependent helicase [Leucobacter sp. CSA1]|uniref:DNA 3'-5' helicase n=1 Tax=Leucobacter chromiisoli TaxID=2796471 RepID=A0A934Q7L6_9MICO|nr:ATP-dependent DNA helicase [Leucobacter chromiisoli]MBK0419246.1 ATP-dependent helicase [Leucobacter chromiisoli]
MSDRAPVFSAARIAELLAVPPNRALLPTEEQRRVIEHPLGGSALVVAGAGSGKTETMAGRVVWLVANGLAQPAQVLGLTFTRKAAGELNERVAGRLNAFAERLAEADERGALSGEEALRAAEILEGRAAGLELPDVSTYNSFASAIVQEFGALAGVAAAAAVIDEATAWRLARDVVCTSDDPELVRSGESIPTLVRRVLEIDHAVSDNLTSFDRVDQVIAEFGRVRSLPYNAKARAEGQEGRLYAVVRDALTNLDTTLLTTRLAREFAERKRRLGLIEFSDQLALAVETLERFPRAGAVVRQRTPVVLLDEVQDTSVGQTRLLSRLFAGCSVMAVGDPHQSIYGWRGASADNLRSFHRDFRGAGAPEEPATLSLSVSWRNPARVLEAAGAIVAPLNAESPVEVPRLRSKEEHFGAAGAAGTDPAQVEWRYPETVDEEYAQLASWLRDAREEHAARTGELPTAAVVFRTRSAMPAVSAALTEAGVPNRIVGVGGLLTTPEITDVVSTLRCLWYADAGSELIRILSGPRFAIGVSDLAGLGEAARWFAGRDTAQQPLDAEDRSEDRALPDPDMQFTLLDALDEIAGMRGLDHAALRGISAPGRERLREAGQLLRQLRQAAGAGIPELLRAIEHGLRLDIELEANERSGYEGGAVARANLDAFVDLVEGFLATDEHGTLASVLAWLERVNELDQAAEHVPEPEPGTVQLITGHGSKGLEWDLVAIPRLTENEFPLPSSEGLGWLRPGRIPDELLGDAAARPALDWRTATTQEDLHRAVNGFTEKTEGGVERVPGYKDLLAERHRAEERRLAYVAVTRAASRLLLTGSFWGGGSRPRSPSVFLRDLDECGIIDGLPEESAHEQDPRDRPDRTVVWPLDPLGSRREGVLRAADALRRALEAPARRAETGSEPRIDPTVELLLAEREAAEARRLAAGAGAGPAAAARPAAASVPEPTSSSGSAAGDGLPERITASTFHEFVEDPETAERRRLRPLPQRPYRRTRIGNRFHEWVERRATTARGTALPLAGLEPGVADPELAEFETEAELAPLIESFERSRWAALQPIAVEQEVTLPFAGRSLVCKLDAVYREESDGEDRYEIVDWKAGRAPRDDVERRSRFFQLDLYRHAYAQWAGVPPERIDVSLFYVAEGVELRGEQPRSLEELERIWYEAAARLAPAR